MILGAESTGLGLDRPIRLILAQLRMRAPDDSACCAQRPNVDMLNQIF